MSQDTAARTADRPPVRRRIAPQCGQQHAQLLRRGTVAKYLIRQAAGGRATDFVQQHIAVEQFVRWNPSALGGGPGLEADAGKTAIPPEV